MYNIIEYVRTPQFTNLSHSWRIQILRACRKLTVFVTTSVTPDAEPFIYRFDTFSGLVSFNGLLDVRDMLTVLA